MEINMKLIMFVLSVISNRKDVQTLSSSLPINRCLPQSLLRCKLVSDVTFLAKDDTLAKLLRGNP